MAGLIGKYPEGLDYTPKGTRVFHVLPGEVFREVDESGAAVGLPRQLVDALQLAVDDWVVYIAMTYPPYSVICLVRQIGKLVSVEVE